MPSVLPFGPSVRTASGDIAESLGSAEKSQVQEALSGDAAAFETVVRLYSRRVYAVAYAITQDVAEAEDIVQETFLKAYQNRQRLRV
jgi:RNA polymerase sigma-70 factor (ECF subfamily)